jgi:acyl-CoA synthetase (AMP-forming)/AMP-acid ligase II
MVSNEVNIRTLVELLQHRSREQPKKIAYIFLRDGVTKEFSLTYQELDKYAQAIALKLLSLASPGERVLLLYPSGLEFIAAFFGCLYAGVIAVPINVPRRTEKVMKLQQIVADAQINLVLTTTSFFTEKGNKLNQESGLTSLQWLLTDSLSIDSVSGWQKQLIDSDTIAFLQYTSGSTGTPKGVMLTHANLLHNQRSIKKAFGHTKTTIFVGWLPLFHDMGLIGNVLQPLYLGIPCTLMSPVAFLQQPIRWLQAISDFKATTSGAPNFAYDLCIRKITSEQLKELDLSSWDTAFVGAEPIRSETLKQFASTFESCGFRWEAFYPCYGMAETTLFVTGGIKKQAPNTITLQSAALEKNQVMIATNRQELTLKIVSCGQSWLDMNVMIVDPDTLKQCSNKQVGEIWISGSSVAQGYWNRVDDTRYAFCAKLTNSNEKSFFRTGDLGFIQDGELYVTGRLKDVIIIRGCNHYPQDIEFTVENSHPALRKGCGAAFSAEIKGEERLIIVYELERSYLRKISVKEVIEHIRRNVAEQNALHVYEAILVIPGTIPKTSSGKVQRRTCCEKFLTGNLRTVKNQIKTLTL